MPASDGPIAVNGASDRSAHSHLWPGVDVATTQWPDRALQRARIAELLNRTLHTRLCVVPGADGPKARITLTNRGAGHDWPSCQAADRRAWVEVVGFDAADATAWSNGVRDDDERVDRFEQPPPWTLHERRESPANRPALMPWEVARVRRRGLSLEEPTTREYALPPEVARVTMRVRLRPFGLDVLDSLIASGDLDPAVRAEIPTFTLESTRLEWRGPDSGCVEGTP